MSPLPPTNHLSPHLRGHLFLFDPRPSQPYPASAATRLWIAAVAIELLRLVAMPRLHGLFPIVPRWLVLATLVGLALLAVIAFARLDLRKIGLRPWRDWTPTEKSYFIQVAIGANVLFLLLFATPLRHRIAQSGLTATLLGVFLPYLFFGFYQELVYRGMLQSALTSRRGAILGVGIANLFYTFGPLHWNYFTSPTAIPMFAGIFAIGLLFGIIYARSGNLWIVAIFHAIGNAFILSATSRPL